MTYPRHRAVRGMERNRTLVQIAANGRNEPILLKKSVLI
jgi:hypothetical protein